jgi:hypothetical protein
VHDDFDLSSAASSRFDYAPLPDWYEPLEFELPATCPPDLIDGGLCYWLSDRQESWLDPSPCRVIRTLVTAVTSDGLQSIGQWDVDFDPGYQSIAIHRVRVIRGAEHRDITSRDAWQVFRRERSLERSIYDGRLTAHLAIPDLRVGDALETIYSVGGRHPLLEGLLLSGCDLQWGCPTKVTRFRLLTPAVMALDFRDVGIPPRPTERMLTGKVVERIWEVQDTVAYKPDPNTPYFAHERDEVRYAPPATWSQVADRFRALYEGDGMPDELQEMVRGIAMGTNSPAERAAEALRLVQTGLRYQTVSIGDGGYVPRDIARIWETRLGDCKDASRLLVAVLRRLDPEAAPALVNTYWGRGLGEALPAANQFDHCIVRVRLDGRSYWLDPTQAPQSGSLQHLTQARFGWALPLVADATLEDMGEHPLTTTLELDEELDFGPRPTSAATLRIRSIHRLWGADSIRREIANGGQAGLAERYRQFTASRYGELRELAPLDVTDREGVNEVETVERYELLSPWTLQGGGRSAVFSTGDDVLGANLQPARTLNRRQPIDMGHCRRVQRRMTIHLPVPLRGGWNDHWSIEGLTATSRLEGSEGRGASVTAFTSIEVSQPILPASLAGAFFDLREAALERSNLVIELAIRDGRFVPPAGQRKSWLARAGSWFMSAVWLILVLAILAAALARLGSVG